MANGNDPDDRSALVTSVLPPENMSRLYAIRTDYRLRWSDQRTRPDAWEAIDHPRRAVRFGAKRSGGARPFFVDSQTDHKVEAHDWSQSADLVLDEDALDASEFERRLDAFTSVALVVGWALDILSGPRPVTVDRLAAWADTLASKRLALAPASASVLPPATQGAEK